MAQGWAVAMSADGRKIVATPENSPFYVLGTNGLGATPNSFLDLTFLGNDKFLITNVQGSVESY